ncbi:BrnA antitoxin family protein [Alcaligenaceae bacterium]|nr:BrnA antitoxin family protein [Alcaligenaceae bacterium]
MQVTSKTGRKIVLPDETEDKAINKGIAADPDTLELGDAFFTKAKPAAQVMGAELVERLKRGRGRPAGSVASQTKEKVNLRLDPDVLAALRATGRGWQTRVNDLLREDIEAGRLAELTEGR